MWERQRFIYQCLYWLYIELYQSFSTLSPRYFWDKVILLNLEFAELVGQESFQDPPLFPIVQVAGTPCHTWILNAYWGSKFRTSHLVSKCLIPCSTSIAHTASLCLMHIYLLSSSFRTYQGTGIGLHSWFNSQLFSDCIWCPVGIRGIILLKKKYSFFKICNRNPILLTSLSA